MLRKIRIALALLCFAGITLLFVGIGHDWWGWLPKLQMMPATLRLIAGAALGNILVVLGILLITLLLGRIYCSVLCPLGVFQDLVLWFRRTLARRFKPLRKRFKFNKERKVLRYAALGVFIACIIAGVQFIVALLEPYSAYGRMITSIVGKGPAPVIITAAITAIVVIICSALWGRAWCNTICPVGTLLGTISRWSIMGIRVDEDKCIKCGSCAKQCKASCLDSETRTVDRSRCVDCFDCIDSCKVKAISFGPVKANGSPAPSKGRRAFIGSTALLVSAAASGPVARAQVKKLDGGLAEVLPKEPLERNPRLVPPGSEGYKAFYNSCTACQLCVTACPNGVLRPSTDLEHLLQPQMGYEKGFCRPECTACSEVCPAGAIQKVTRDQKTLIRIGTAVVNPSLCFAAQGKETCGNCAHHCPTGAISMMEIDGSLRPVVAEEQCIGCGKCEYLCPSRPVSAITVKGLEIHINK